MWHHKLGIYRRRYVVPVIRLASWLGGARKEVRTVVSTRRSLRELKRKGTLEAEQVDVELSVPISVSHALVKLYMEASIASYYQACSLLHRISLDAAKAHFDTNACPLLDTNRQAATLASQLQLNPFKSRICGGSEMPDNLE